MAKKNSKQTNFRKKWAAIIAVFVILFITFLAIKPTYFKAPTQSNSSNETADWKTYNSKSFTALYPSDWTEFKYKNSPYDSDPLDEDIEFRSPDYEENLYPFITNGAYIKVTKRPNTKNQSLEQYIENGLVKTTKEESLKTLNKVFYGINTYQNIFSCWEGCRDLYYLESDNAIYMFAFECQPGCGSKEEVDKNKYAKSRDLFLGNINFQIKTE
jgi:hypothetical protein